MSVRRRIVKARVERERRLADGLKRVHDSLNALREKHGLKPIVRLPL